MKLKENKDVDETSSTDKQLLEENYPSSLKMKIYDDLAIRGRHHQVVEEKKTELREKKEDLLKLYNNVLSYFKREDQAFARSIFENYLHDQSLGISVDPKTFELSINGEKILNSNILEVLKFLLERRTGEENEKDIPAGSTEIYNILVRAGVPQRWFENKRPAPVLLREEPLVETIFKHKPPKASKKKSPKPVIRSKGRFAKQQPPPEPDDEEAKYLRTRSHTKKQDIFDDALVSSTTNRRGRKKKRQKTSIWD